MSGKKGRDSPDPRTADDIMGTNVSGTGCQVLNPCADEDNMRMNVIRAGCGGGSPCPGWEGLSSP